MGTRPAAVNFGAPNQAAAGSTLPQIMTDTANLRGQLSNARRPAIVMHSDRLRELEMQITTEGNFPFESRIASGNLWGMTLVSSPFVPSDVVTGIDAAALWIASDAPELIILDSATIVTVNTVAPAPQMTATGATQDAVDVGGSIQVSDAATTGAEVRSTY